MSRTRTVPAAPVWVDPELGGLLVLPLRTITPMFGGGATTREADDRHPIRPAAIRGQLRYWWRATVGAQCADHKELFEKESALWGSTETHGAVRLTVLSGSPGKRVALDQVGEELDRGRRSSPAQDGPREGYFLFPFQEQVKERKPAAQGRTSITFTLTLVFPEEWRGDVERAVRAWLLFGGVGARTRRGCGALECTDPEARRRFHPPIAEAALKSWLRELAGPAAAKRPDWATLAGGKLLLGDAEEPLRIWRNLGRFWSRFRKGHYTDRRPDYSPMSGGEWEDHKLLRQWERQGGAELPLAKPHLGLPIIYQAFEAKGNKPASFGGTITSEETSRMTSPIVLKPTACADGRYRYLVAYLIGKRPTQVKIDGSPVKLVAPTRTPVLAALEAGGPLNAVMKATDYERWGEGIRVDI